MIDINPNISIITLSTNGLNITIKRYIVRVDKTIPNSMLFKKPTLNIMIQVY